MKLRQRLQANMHVQPLRLSPGSDLRASIEAALIRGDDDAKAAFVLQGIGSLSVAQVRFAGVDTPTDIRGDLEILTLAGSVSADGAHLHITLSDNTGRVMGGHVAAGCIVRTTAELLLATLPGYAFTRRHDAATGFPELQIHTRPGVP